MRLVVVLVVLGFNSIAFAIPETTVSHRPSDFLETIKNDPTAGQQIYQEFCASCHAVQPRINIGAPRFRNQKDWQNYSQLSLDTLLKMADNGLGQMPPRGGCFECSDENLKAAITYMLPTQKQ